MKVGIDIVEVDRLINKEKLWNKLLTQDEISYAKKFKNPAVHVAGFFAAKEALVKAMGTGFSDFYLKDIQVVHDEKGKPVFEFSQKILLKYSPNLSNVNLSISHEQHYAVAVVIIEDNSNG